MYILSTLDEGSGNEVNPLWDTKINEVLHVLLLQHWKFHLNPWEVAILALAQLAIVHYLSHHVIHPNRLDLQRERSIGAKDDVAWLDRGAKLVVRKREASTVAFETVVDHQLQVLALLQLNALADIITEEACADLRTFSVQEDGHRLVWTFGRRLTDPLHCRTMCLVVAMRKVQTANVHASIDELHEHVHIPASWAHRADDLALAFIGVASLIETRQSGQLARCQIHLRLRHAHQGLAAPAHRLLLDPVDGRGTRG
mmetsp:Transcript_118287/g.307238  ORF Transcript_118287/g.307238 Transcript_118287/m.307238 type:complete len:256 (-) Transcript_118287:163-930(-)